jgi:capsid protein
MKLLANMESIMENSQPEALARWQQRLLEIIDAQWDRFVDPADAVFDDDGLRWGILGLTPGLGLGAGLAFATEAQLREIRGQCRELAVSNEFAINGHENRINYIVGTGHSYRVSARSGDCPAELVRQTQAVLDTFLRENRWHKRQQEIVRRKDRDGECFLRFFDARDGGVRVRFVEPEQVTTPPQAVDDRAASFGILTDAADVETVRGYFVDGKLVRADEIQHRKENVDANVKRGIPLFFPVRKNLRRAEKLLRNMSVVAEIQSAIAIIRKHASGTRGALEQFAHDGADVCEPRPGGRAGYFRRYGPGTILDVLGDTDYQFPASGLDAGRYVTVLQAELRAIASRLVMPEFMLTSDASNANYASTMVAEGPAVRMFERMQHDMIEDDVKVMWRVVGGAVDSGRLTREALTSVDIQCLPPPLAVRDRLKEVQADRILVQSGAMSVQTMAARNGLDPTHEQQLIKGDAVAGVTG